MFAKIENSRVVEWPVLSVIARFPHISFPSPLTDADLPAGYVSVGVIAPPEIRGNQKAVPGQPVQQDGKWVQSWDVEEMTASEIAERVDVQATNVRFERNRLLTESDWTQVADAPVDQAAWAAYRQALRDITAQPGFPANFEWPQAPSQVSQ